MATSKKGKTRKKRVSVKKSHQLNFEIEDYCLDVGVGSALLAMKFRDASDDSKLWKVTTYLKAWGTRIWVGDEEILDLTVYGEPEARDLSQTKGDYLEYIEGDHRWERRPRTRVRKGIQENVYREVRGFGYSYKTRTETKQLCWSLSLWMTPEYVSHVLHLLAMKKRMVLSAYLQSEGRHYWMQNFSITNDPYEVDDYFKSDAQLDEDMRNAP